MLRASKLRGLVLASLFGATEAAARKPHEEKVRTTMSDEPHDPAQVPSLVVRNVSATRVAFASDGHRWAAADGLRLHTGRDAQQAGSVDAVASPNDSLAFDGAHVRFGRALFTYADAGPARAEVTDDSLREALAAALPRSPSLEVAVVATSTDGSVQAAVGRTRPSRKLHAPSVAERAALVVIAGGGATTAWTGPVSDAPARLVVAGQRVVAAGVRFLVVDAATGRALLDQPNPSVGTVNGLAVEGDVAYTAAADGSVAAIGLVDGRERWRVRPATEPLRAVAVDAAHDVIVAAGWDDSLHVLSAEDGRSRASIPMGAHVEALALSADGTRVLVALGGTVHELRVVVLVVGVLGR